MTQSEQILEHVKRYGSITPAEAYAQFGCLALHSRAPEIRAAVRPLGFDFVCQIRTKGKKRWGEYRLQPVEGSLL